MLMSASGTSRQVLAQFGRSVVVSDLQWAGNSRLIVALGAGGALCSIDVRTRRVVPLGPAIGGIGNGTCEQRSGPLSLGANDRFTVSDDGRRVAYVEDSPYENDNTTTQGFRIDDFAIGVVSSVGGAGHMLPEPIDASDTAPSFSPDGTQVVFARSFLTAGVASEPSLMTQSVSGGQARPLHIEGDDPVWSPNGRWIVFQYRSQQTESRNFPDGLGIVGASGGSQRTLLHMPVGVGLGVSWSPNSKSVAFFTEGRRMGIVTLAGKVTFFPLQRHVPDIGYSINGSPGNAPRWSPDGKTLTFAVMTNGREYQTRMYSIGANGRGLHPIGSGAVPARTAAMFGSSRSRTATVTDPGGRVVLQGRFRVACFLCQRCRDC